MTQLRALAVVAGGGAFPSLIAHTMKAGGTNVFVVHLEHDSDRFEGFDCMVARPEQLSSVFTALRKRGIKDLVLIGRMKRPKLSELRPDWFTLKLIPMIAWQLLFGGDDALLRAVRGMLEKQGFMLHGIHDLVSDLTAPVGTLGSVKPDDAQMVNIHLGIPEALRHGARDAGQAVVMRDGKVAGREDASGTDALIRSFAHANKAILVKMAKPQQDRALDLPTIGPDTVRLCAESGFAGIAVEAGATLIADRDRTIQLADQHGLFLIGVKA